MGERFSESGNLDIKENLGREKLKNLTLTSLPEIITQLLTENFQVDACTLL